MMKIFTRYLIRGVLTLLPLILTIYPLYHFFAWTDRIANGLFRQILPGIEYIPGTGLIVGLLTLFLLGLLMSSRQMQQIYALIEIPFRRIPLVKSLYNAIKELAIYLTPDEQKHANNVVLVRVPGYQVDVVGFVMRNDISDLPEEIEKNGRSVVYIPLSYQVGGLTLFLPNTWLTPIDMPVEEAMKNTLTGWITRDESAEKHTSSAH